MIEFDKLNKDQLFLTDDIQQGSFSFNKDVVSVFDDMITRSVPFFSDIQQMIVNYFDLFSQSNSAIYDFGCSTGLTLFKLMETAKQDCTFFALDNSLDMLTVLKERQRTLDFENNLIIQNVDLNVFKNFERSSFGVFNLVLQFLDYESRLSLLSSFYKSLLSGAAIVVVEKVVFSDEKYNQYVIDQFRAFKQSKGYSRKEILMKEKSLDGVLKPLTVGNNIKNLREAGFDMIETFFQWYNFIGILAVKR